ncbi:DNA-directed RNA polymerase, partial [Streptococcus agalactiae]
LEALRTLGMVEVARHKEWNRGKMRERLTAALSADALAIVQRISGLVELTMPLHMPCIEPPKPWTALNDGGYHTSEMRYVMPHCVVMRHVKSPAVLDELRAHDWGTVLKAINSLQQTAWQINREMLETILTVAKHHNMDEIVSQAESPRPPRPEWLTDDLKKENMDDDQLREFHMWKREMAQWHTDRRLQGTKWGRFYTATRVANEMKEHDAIYFVYQADFRGRLYAQTTGVSPQGSDLQKSLLRFSRGLPLATDAAVQWFKINGANRFGVDKVPYADRIAWVDEHAARIVAMAEDPVSNFGWAEADSPLQFLAWAKEFAKWLADPATFVSHIAVGMDGSCNGLQHFSA